MRAYRYIWVVMMVWSGLGLSAQQLPQWSHVGFNTYMLNPAYAGLDFSLSATGSYRSQWVGLEGSPSTISLSAHMPIYAADGAVGLQIYRDRVGPLTATQVAASYNYALDMGGGLLSAGARLGLVQVRLAGQDITTPTGIYTGSAVNHNDPLLPRSLASGIGMSFETGVYFVSRSFHAGVAAMRFPSTDITVGDANVGLVTHFNAFFKYQLEINEQLQVEPRLVLQSDGHQLQSDLLLTSRINGNVFGGLGLRGYNSTSLDAIVLLAGIVIDKNYTLTYSFDTGLSELKRVNEGSHEITLNYNLHKIIGAAVAPPIIYNPRNL